MSESTIQLVDDITSVNGSAASGTTFRVAGQKVTVQTAAPASLVAIQISNDGQAWTTGTNEENSDLSSLGELTETLKEKPEFVRAQIASDTSGPRLFRVMFNITKVN